MKTNIILRPLACATLYHWSIYKERTNSSYNRSIIVLKPGKVFKTPRYSFLYIKMHIVYILINVFEESG